VDQGGGNYQCNPKAQKLGEGKPMPGKMPMPMGMPPMLPMPMPKPKMPMPMPQPQECKENEQKQPDGTCKATNKALDNIFNLEPPKEDSEPKSIVQYGKDLFGKLFGVEEAVAEPTSGQEDGSKTTIDKLEPFDSSVFTSFDAQPPLPERNPNANIVQVQETGQDNVLNSIGGPSDTFGAAQEFEARAASPETQGIVSRIGAGARAIVDNLRRFFGLGG
jgi:hypothetical protein